jgi:acyl-CoA synthetase (NDP forming)
MSAERRRPLEDNPLHALLRPARIAVVGASADKQKVGGRPIPYLTAGGYAGEILPINPRREEIDGLRCYPSLREVDGVVDLAVLAVPAPMIRATLEEAAEVGVRAAIIYSAGFGELSSEGSARQEELAKFAKHTGLRIVGPNCQGLVDVAGRVVNCWAMHVTNRLPSTPGPVAWIGQSGAVGTLAFDRLLEAGTTINYWAATGNEVDVSVTDLVEYVIEDETTRIVCGYVEHLRDPARMLRVAGRARELGIPIVMVKGGLTESGANATRTHTGALAGSAETYRGFFEQAGIVMAEDIEELASIAACAVAEPSLIGRERLNILSNSGGIGVLAADMASDAGLEVPALDHATIAALGSVLPEFIHPANPTDISLAFFDNPGAFGEAISVIGHSERFDAHLVALMGVDDSAPGVPEGILDGIAKASTGGTRPVLVHMSTMRTDFTGYARRAGLTVVPDLRRGIRSVAKLAAWHRFADQQTPEPAPLGGTSASEHATASSTRTLSEAAAKARLAEAGLPVIRGVVARSVEDAVQAADRLGYPVALKVVSPDIPHKAAVGGLALGLAHAEELRAAYPGVMDQPGARIEGALVESMAGEGLEVLVALRCDPVFRYVVVLGLGGSFVELANDVAVRMAPVDRREIERMLLGLRGARLLFDDAGRPRFDLEALETLVGSLVAAGTQSGGAVREVELNPVLVRPPGEGAVILDALWIEDRA